MKEMNLFQALERQVEDEAKRWKEERLKELIKEHIGDEAEISPLERTKVDQKKTDDR